jgi:hypothetical protein
MTDIKLLPNIRVNHATCVLGATFILEWKIYFRVHFLLNVRQENPCHSARLDNLINHFYSSCTNFINHIKVVSYLNYITWRYVGMSSFLS